MQNVQNLMHNISRFPFSPMLPSSKPPVRQALLLCPLERKYARMQLLFHLTILCKDPLKTIQNYTYR